VAAIATGRLPPSNRRRAFLFSEVMVTTASSTTASAFPPRCHAALSLVSSRGTSISIMYTSGRAVFISARGRAIRSSCRRPTPPLANRLPRSTVPTLTTTVQTTWPSEPSPTCGYSGVTVAGGYFAAPPLDTAVSDLYYWRIKPVGEDSSSYNNTPPGNHQAGSVVLPSIAFIPPRVSLSSSWPFRPCCAEQKRAAWPPSPDCPRSRP